MMRRFSSVGAALLLTLACGPKVEIGHGNGASGDNGTAGVGGTRAGGAGGQLASGGSDDVGGEGGEQNVPRGGSGLVGGPIPLDDGPQAEVTKVDLLLAIDNSISMSDKQALLRKAMPELLKRLVSPNCVNSTGVVQASPALPDDACPAGSQREFEPLRDLHVGVITSSLGSHGATGARDVCVSGEDDDHAYLIPFVRDDVPSYDNRGYLKWDPDQVATPPGEDSVQAFADSMETMLASVGEQGCGYEAQLESVYRFLVDPEPPVSIEQDQSTRQTRRVGVDNELLTQRANFLRPDSSVVVLLLTDENDCSIQDEGYGWLATSQSALFRSTSACLADVNDECCQSCGEAVANAGCTPIAEDSECAKGATYEPSSGLDNLNLRCFEQKRRFGFDMLYPTARYVSGFGGGTVRKNDGSLVENPLFHRGRTDRDPSLFTLAVVGGVPWQDLATANSLESATLDYMTPEALVSSDRWAVILGDPANAEPPLDPFMRESVAARSGKNPIVDATMVASSSEDPRANAINGHEHVASEYDLQYACTFELPEPIVCDSALEEAGVGCDCYEADLPFNRPVCNPPGGGAVTTTQHYGRAYPSLRPLAVAKELGRRSVLGSVCARNTQDDTRSDYGYRSVFGSLGRRIASTLVK